MNSRVAYFLLGTVVGPVLTSIVRPVAREIIKGGILLGRGVTKLSAEVSEELSSLAEEASDELDTGRPARKRGRVVAH